MQRRLDRVVGWGTIVACGLAVSPAIAERDALPRGEDVVESPATADALAVHHLFQSHMVLQRDRPITVWGQAAPGETVTVTFDGREQAATAAADRSWRVTFPALPASAEPRTMVVAGQAATVTLDDVLLGDVWVCGGQSNMEFPISKVEGGDLEIASANFPTIRLLTIPQGASQTPTANFARLEEWSDWDGRHFRKGSWDVCSPETVREFSAIGYVFARRLAMAAQVPIGMIDVSRGGTRLEAWTPIDVLRSIDTPEVKAELDAWDARVAAWDPEADLEQRVARFRDRVKAGKAGPEEKEPTDLAPGPAFDMNRPGNCHGGMLATMTGLRVKGAIWHQGYNNALGETTRGGVLYRQVFPRMIEAWRRTFDDARMPFGILSLCTEQEPQSLENFLTGLADNGCFIREAHLLTFLDLRAAGDKAVGFASSDDLRRSWYHPQIKIPGGERLARWALATQYDKRLRWLPPMIREMKVEGSELVVTLDSDAQPFHDGPIEGFAVAGADRRFHPATARYPQVNGKPSSRSMIHLSSPFVPAPVAYRYAWHRNPMGNLKSSDHTELPMPIQRSDSWTMNDIYEAYTGKPSKSPTALDRGERGALVKALKDADRDRRIPETEAALTSRPVRGWTVHVSTSLANAEPEATARALELLDRQLAEIERVVPAAAVATLREVPLYFSPEYAGVKPKAEYHPDPGWLREHGRDPGMARGVEFTNIPTFAAETDRMPNFVLHELAHAYHHRVLPNGFDNADIAKSYERAKAAGLYDRVERWLGTGRPQTTERAYALTNPQEFFAEATEAFFSRNDFFPFTKADLLRHDPATAEMVAAAWGMREEPLPQHPSRPGGGS